jgi:predicted naringenin-chalcone synthase
LELRLRALAFLEDYGFAAAFGPGLSAEVLLQWN